MKRDIADAMTRHYITSARRAKQAGLTLAAARYIDYANQLLGEYSLPDGPVLRAELDALGA